MRYLAGFIGGLVVGVLLLVFQEYLISGERTVDVTPRPQITLSLPRVSEPPETKDYRKPKQPPELPEATEQPVTAIDPPPVTPPPRPQPARLDGKGIYIPGRLVTDGNHFPAGDGPAIAIVTVAPRYPVDALRGNIEGEVEVEFTVLPDGSVTDVRVINANPPGMFEQEARRAVLRWQFRPQMQDGRPTSMRARQVIEFRLPAE